MLKTVDWSFTEETDLLIWFQRGKGDAHVIITGDNIEGILAVRDNVILAEPNDLGPRSQLQLQQNTGY